VVELAKKERAFRVDFIIALGPFEERRLHLRAGYSSLFAWLTERMRFPNASAFRRQTAARLCRRMPAAAAYLREGRLSLTKLCSLKDSLAPENCLALLEQAASMTEREVEVLAAQLHPDAVTKATRDTIRPLSCGPPPSQGELFATAPPSPAVSPPSVAVPAPEAVPAARHVVRMTVGGEFLKLLEDVRAAFSHSHPGAPLEVLFGECMKIALEVRHARSRGKARRPRAPKEASPKNGSRYVPAALRRQIWERDGGRCTFVAEDGTRCATTHRLEIHHDIPFALGGPTDAASCRLMCKGHNDLMARRDFGDELMDRVAGRARPSLPLVEVK